MIEIAETDYRYRHRHQEREETEGSYVRDESLREVDESEGKRTERSERFKNECIIRIPQLRELEQLNPTRISNHPSFATSHSEKEERRTLKMKYPAPTKDPTRKTHMRPLFSFFAAIYPNTSRMSVMGDAATVNQRYSNSGQYRSSIQGVRDIPLDHSAERVVPTVTRRKQTERNLFRRNLLSIISN